MEKRKNPEKDLRNKSGLFFQIGLLSAMILVVSAFEYRTDVIEPVVCNIPTEPFEDEIITLTTQDPPPPPPPAPKPILANPVEADPDDPEPEIPKVLTFDPGEIKIPDVIEPDAAPVEKAEEPPGYAEVMPSFDGFYEYLRKNMKYPSTPRRMRIEGKVFVQFIVDKDGRVTDVKAIKGVHKDLDAEAVRVLSESPNWSPARQGGRRIKVRMVVPIVFKLN